MDLKKTLGVSLMVHFAAGLLFQVKIESGISVFRYESMRLSFLGAILDYQSVNVVPLGEIKSAKTVHSWYPHRVLAPSLASLPRENQSRGITAALNQNLADWRPSEELPPSLDVKDIHLAPSRFLLVKGNESPFFTIEGALKERGVLFKPDLLEYLNTQGEDIPDRIRMVFRFRVSKEGIVEQVDPILSSGNTELDLYGMRFLRQWKFIPDEVNQEGLFKIHFSKKTI